MIVDTSIIIDIVTDVGAPGKAGRRALAQLPTGESLIAPGHFAVEVLSALKGVAGRPTNTFTHADIPDALGAAEALDIQIEPTPWADVHRAWELAGSLRYTDAVYVAAAERYATTLLTSDARIERSGAPMRCRVQTVIPDPAFDDEATYGEGNAT